jgi:hypothetical protein
VTVLTLVVDVCHFDSHYIAGDIFRSTEKNLTSSLAALFYGLPSDIETTVDSADVSCYIVVN